MNWYLKVLKEYANFKGRARRSEYWYFCLVNVLVSFGFMALDNVLGFNFSYEMPGQGLQTLPYGYLYIAYAFVVLIPSLAVAVRRLHDIGKSGWTYLWALIPLLGAIYVIVLLAKDSMPGENQYGPNPKEI